MYKMVKLKGCDIHGPNLDFLLFCSENMPKLHHHYRYDLKKDELVRVMTQALCFLPP